MMPNVCRAGGRLYAAVHLIRLMPFNFDLYRGVIDAVVMVQLSHDGFQNLLPLADGLFRNQNVTTARHRARADRPYMKIMHV